MIFRTKLDGPATHTTAGSRRSICVMPDNVSRLGAAVECSNPPKAAVIVPIKLQASPSLGHLYPLALACVPSSTSLSQSAHPPV
jgi:hypothetical protein